VPGIGLLIVLTVTGGSDRGKLRLAPQVRQWNKPTLTRGARRGWRGISGWAGLNAVRRYLYELMNCRDRHIRDDMRHAGGGKQPHPHREGVHIHHEIYFATTLQPNLREKVGQDIHIDPELAHIGTSDS